MKEIEEAGIEMMYCASAMIAKKVIERGKRLRHVGIAAPVDNVKPFAGVRMIEAKSIFSDYFRGI